MKQVKRSSKNSSYQNVEGILAIGRDGLCHRCGGCVGICPADTLALDGDCFPMQVGECISCSLCTDICSGAAADFQAIGTYLFGPEYCRRGPLGETRQAYVGHSTDEKIRWAGASGGVVTRLLMFLLETGKIQGALVAGPHPDDPALGLGYVARSSEELLASSQSRYTTVPMLTALKEIRKDKKGRYAVVALPCHAHTLRKLQMKNAGWQRRISLIIGLYCHYRLPHEATREAAAIVAPAGTKLSAIKYRQKDNQGWPHNTVEMTFSDGSKWRSPYGPAQTVSMLAHCYPRGRCLHCVDALVEFGDLAIGDPWIRGMDGGWKYTVPGGRSGIIIRTADGEHLIDDAVKAGDLEVNPIPVMEVVQGQYVMIMEKFTGTPLRMSWLQRLGRALPDYGIDFSPATAAAQLREGRFLLMRLITVYGPIRRFFLRLGFSRIGLAFMGWRRKFNQKKAVSRLKAAK